MAILIFIIMFIIIIMIIIIIIIKRLDAGENKKADKRIKLFKEELENESFEGVEEDTEDNAKKE